MLHLRVYGRSRAPEVGGSRGSWERAERGARPGGAAGHVLLTAEVHPASADAVLEFLVHRGVAADDIALARLDEITPVAGERAATSLIWADV